MNDLEFGFGGLDLAGFAVLGGRDVSHGIVLLHTTQISATYLAKLLMQM